MSLPAASPTDNHLYGRRLLLARIGWVTVTLTVIALNLIALPDTYGRFFTTADLTLQDLRDLHQIGLSVTAYGIILTLQNAPIQLVNLALALPIFIALAILRSRLWDIDTLINKALVYGSLTALLGMLYAGLIIGLEALIELLGGRGAQNPVALVVSTLAIFALFTPARQRLQHLIDRRFYRRKYDAEKTLAAFSATLRNEVNLNDLREHLLAVVQETMQPAHVSLWLRPPERHSEEPARQHEL